MIKDINRTKRKVKIKSNIKTKRTKIKNNIGDIIDFSHSILGNFIDRTLLNIIKYYKNKKTNTIDIIIYAKYVEYMYNEFNKNECNICMNNKCRNIDNLNLLSNKGWIMLKKHKNTCSIGLRLLDSIRIYLVEYYYLKYFKENEYNNIEHHCYSAIGSTNITSDYDITIIGPKSYEIGKYMYENFHGNVNNIGDQYSLGLTKNHILELSYIFDTNLYMLGIYNNYINYFKKSSDELLHIQYTNENIVNTSFKHKNSKMQIQSVQPIDEKGYDLCLISLRNKIKLLLNNKVPWCLIDIFKNIKHTTNSKLKCIHGINNEKRCYEEYFKNSKKLYHYMNTLKNTKNKNKNKIIEIICDTSVYAMESYYTPCSMNIVVFQIQSSSNTKFNEYNYIIAMIENMIDFIFHCKNKNTIEESVFINCSKYLSRIYFCLTQLFPNDNDIKKRKKMIDDIVYIRKGIVSNDIYGDILFYVKDNLNRENSRKKILQMIQKQNKNKNKNKNNNNNYKEKEDNTNYKSNNEYKIQRNNILKSFTTEFNTNINNKKINITNIYKDFKLKLMKYVK